MFEQGTRAWCWLWNTVIFFTCRRRWSLWRAAGPTHSAFATARNYVFLVPQGPEQRGRRQRLHKPVCPIGIAARALGKSDMHLRACGPIIIFL